MVSEIILSEVKSLFTKITGVKVGSEIYVMKDDKMFKERLVGIEVEWKESGIEIWLRTSKGLVSGSIWSESKEDLLKMIDCTDEDEEAEEENNIK